MLENVGGRKFLAAFVFLFIALGVDLLSPKGLSENICWLITCLYSGLVAGNVGEYFANRKGLSPKLLKQMQQQPSQTIQHDEELKVAVSELMQGQKNQAEALSFLVNAVRGNQAQRQGQA